MKNIMVITPFYPHPHKSRFKQDSKAVYYLCKYSNENERIIVVYYYQHTRINAVRAFPRLLKRDSYDNHIYRDDFGHDVLLFEHPCLMPHSYKTFRFFDKRYARMIDDFLKKNGIIIDSLVVHFPVRFTPLAEMIKSKKKVAILHSFDVEVKKRLLQTNRYLNSYDRIGFRSKQIKQKLLDNGYKVENDFLCMSGVPNEIVNRGSVEREWKKDNVLHISFVGRLNSNKNVKTIIQALNILKDSINFEFTVMGDGDEKRNLELLTLEYGLLSNVHFTGNLPREEVLSNLRKTDVFILISFKETLGISYLEAMASGNIVIGAEDRGIDGIATEKQGVFFVNPSNFHQLAETIMLINSMELDHVKKMRNESYSFMTNLTEEKVSRYYLDAVQFT